MTPVASSVSAKRGQAFAIDQHLERAVHVQPRATFASPAAASARRIMRAAELRVAAAQQLRGHDDAEQSAARANLARH